MDEYNQFYGTLVGGLLSLLGTFVALRFSNKWHEDRIDAENKRAEKEREFLAKKAAFARASDALAAVTHFVITTPERVGPLTESHQSMLREFHAAFSAVHLYASFETLERLIALGTAVNAAMADVFAAQVKVEHFSALESGQRLILSTLDSLYDQFHREIVAMLPDAQCSEWMLHLRQQSSDNRRQAVEINNQLGDVARQRIEAVVECRAAVIRAAPDMLRASHHLLLSARRELGFFIGERRYEELMDEATRKSFADVERTLEERQRQAMALVNSLN